MHNSHTKNTVRYYLLLAFVFLFLFFSNDFGLTDVQKTAIVMAVGIDREEDTFILTSQIAIPQSSKQGQASQTVQLVSRGETIAEAFEEINAKTGWYPKLVFCKLILLGERTTQHNVFDALDYFLRDEYLSDNCFVATCDGLAKDLLDTSALVDPSSSTAIQKVLSNHAERVGTVLPNTLKNFAISHFSESSSGFLPIVKKEAQQEQMDAPDLERRKKKGTRATKQEGEQSQNAGDQKDKPVFSAGETALFVNGIKVERLNSEESFALSAVLNKLRLASYSVRSHDKTCTLTIKNNASTIQLRAGDAPFFQLSIHVTMTAGVLDFSKAQSLESIKDLGDVPTEYFSLAERKLEGELQTLYEKCRLVGCDLFGVRERLIKHGRRSLHKYANTAFQNTILSIKIRFRNVR